MSANTRSAQAAVLLIVLALALVLSLYIGPIRPTYNTAVVLAGTSLLGASAGLVGAFAVLRGRALVGDALAHAALPGLGLAFLAAGHLSMPALLAGAFVTGLAGVAVVTLLRRLTRIKEDAAIGIVLSVFFGAGIVLSQRIQQSTVTGSQAGLDSYIFGKTAGMIRSDVYLIAAVSVGCLLAISLLYKEFKMIVFDAGFARAQGWPVVALDFALMGLVAIAVVIGLPAVGVVLMAALLILPAASARFWTDRFGMLLVFAGGFGLATGALGTLISASASHLPAGPIIVLVGTGIFLVSLLFAPRRGGLARWSARIALERKLAEEQLLALLYEQAEPRVPERAALSLAELRPMRPGDRARLEREFEPLVRDGLVERVGAERYRLTEQGWRQAAKVVRSHRLWKLFLLEYPDEASSLASLEADAMESALPPEARDRMERMLAARGELPPLDA